MKYASLLVICSSLVAGTAAAAIPDSSGVFHGCYNLLSGSLKVIDGTSCGLLERHVTWQQTGIQGPVGPQGAQGPTGPAGSNAHVIVGFGRLGSITLDDQVPNRDNKTFLPEDTAFTAALDGKCHVSFNGWLVDTNEPRVQMYPIYVEDGVEHMDIGSGAVLSDAGPRNLAVLQGSTAMGFDIEAGKTYRFGVSLLSPEIVQFHALSSATIVWTCAYNDD